MCDDNLNKLKIPKKKPEDMLHLNQGRINQSISMLSHTLSAIEKLEKIAWDEFEVWKQEVLRNNDDYDSVIYEDTMLFFTENSLYGSFSVIIAASVEDQLNKLLTYSSIKIVNSKGKNKDKKASKPHFDDYLYTLKKK
jgi:hypothetical protein